MYKKGKSKFLVGDARLVINYDKLGEKLPNLATSMQINYYIIQCIHTLYRKKSYFITCKKFNHTIQTKAYITCLLYPRVILTDMDPAMNAACQTIYKGTYRIHCI